MNKAYFWALLCMVGISLGQLIFKFVGNRLSGNSFTSLITQADILAAFSAGLVLYGVATIFWVLALRDLPLSRAYIFMALAFVLVPVGAWLVFGEALSLRYWAGVFLIVAGIVVSAT